MKLERIYKMSNKLKDIFSNKMFEMGGVLKFENDEAYNKFIESINLVYDKGCTVKLEGVSSISTNIKDGTISYPHIIEVKPINLTISPSNEPIPIFINAKSGKKNIELERYQVEDSIILQTSKNEIVFLKFIFNKNNYHVQFTYKIQMNFAKEIEGVIESYDKAIGILKYIFNLDNCTEEDNNNLDLLNKVIQSFKISYLFWNKLKLIENKIKVKFDLSKIGDIDNNIIFDVEELYLFLIENKPLRMNYKFTLKSNVIISEHNEEYLKIGQEVSVNFVSKIEYFICEQKITVHTANLLSNAKIKEIEDKESRETKILYGDTDSEPMYISCTGYLAYEEAIAENELFAKDKELIKKYKEAWTVDEYYKQELNELDKF